MSTAIEWTDETWNPVVGCSKISEGCRNCYAEGVANRFGFTTKPWTAANAPENVKCFESRLTQPLHWHKPRRVFVNSMSDLFHEEVPFDFIDKVFTIMLACAIFENRRHTFQILTKRPKRMLEYLNSRTPVEHLKAWAHAGDYWIIMDDPDIMFSEYVAQFVSENRRSEDFRSVEYLPWSQPENLFPLRNVWLGVSVEDQKTADERIPLLLQAPAAMRFLSCEPLLGPVNLKLYDPALYKTVGWWPTIANYTKVGECLHWVIVGGESGPKARPMHPEWARSLRDQCQEAGVPFFFKQWGQWADRTSVGERWSGSEIILLTPNGAIAGGGDRRNGVIENGPSDWKGQGAAWMCKVARDRQGACSMAASGTRCQRLVIDGE